MSNTTSSSGSSHPGPDYSLIDSLAKAEELHARGELARCFLLPLEFGGMDVPPNVVYVPPFVVKAKSDIEQNIVIPLANEGKVTRYAAEPSYQGNSFVPSSLKIIASEPEQFTSVLQIWGGKA